MEALIEFPIMRFDPICFRKQARHFIEEINRKGMPIRADFGSIGASERHERCSMTTASLMASKPSKMSMAVGAVHCTGCQWGLAACGRD
jgi:hypothetical protein